MVRSSSGGKSARKARKSIKPGTRRKSKAKKTREVRRPVSFQERVVVLSPPGDIGSSLSRDALTVEKRSSWLWQVGLILLLILPLIYNPFTRIEKPSLPRRNLASGPSLPSEIKAPGERALVHKTTQPTFVQREEAQPRIPSIQDVPSVPAQKVVLPPAPLAQPKADLPSQPVSQVTSEAPKKLEKSRPQSLVQTSVESSTERSAEKVSGPIQFKVTESGLSLSVMSSVLYGTSKKWKKIAAWNGIQDPYRIYIGQTLTLEETPLIDPNHLKVRILDLWHAKHKLHQKNHPSPSPISSMSPSPGPQS